MAKTFNDIVGVVALDKDGKECCDFKEGSKYTITFRGDIIFKLNLHNNTIEKKQVKYVEKFRNGSIVILYVCDANEKRDLIPFGTSRNIMQGKYSLEKVNVLKTRNSSGLFFLKLEDAINHLNDINNGKYFGSLSDGDVIYFCDKAQGCISEIKVNKVGENPLDFYINAEKDDRNGKILMCDSFYEKNASYFTDCHFYTYKFIGGDFKKYSFHIDKKDAEKALNAYLKSVASSIKKKEKKKEENPIGKPLQLKDNKGHELKIGDRVVYVRKSYYGHTDLSFAVILGETPTKIKLFDEEEKCSERRTRWGTNNGLHAVEK